MRRKALAMAVITTVLWSGSYILNKLAFQGGIGPLSLSGLRYFFASLILLIMGRGKRPEGGQGLPVRLAVLLGIMGYAIAQGLQYVGQSYLNPTQSSLFLAVGNTTLVMLADMVWLRENQTWRDLYKMLLLISGIALYYYPWASAGFSAVGMLCMAVSSTGYAVNMTLNRRLLTTRQMNARILTAQPMFAGSLVLLAAGLAIEGLPALTWRLALILVYLSCFSGALGFYLWTRSQSALTAFESSSINNLMLIEIALMDLLIFNRQFSVYQATAVLVVFGSIILIQFKKRK